MAMIDFSDSIKSYWDYYGQINGFGSFVDFYIYDYSVGNLNAEQTVSSGEVEPQIILTSVQVLENNTEVNQSQTLKYSEKTIDTATSTTTNGIKFIVAVKDTIQVDFSAHFSFAGKDYSAQIGAALEYNFSTSTANTQTTEKLWSLTQPVIVPPYSTVVATLQIYNGTASIPINLSGTVYGNGSYNGNTNYLAQESGYKSNGSKDYWIGPASELANNSWPDKPENYVSSNDSDESLNYTGSTRADLTMGLFSQIKFEQRPLPGHNGETKTFYSPLILANNKRLIPSAALGNDVPIINK
ncbi:ETX/MTX2 family pore-forming toxin [Bacillus sp. IBL03825]|uniref:ETX/MTX2 family pore-forming toxin n=1 Tax=Bacillus sp. IBL03825 TaxID=2953580 RepID=UPI002157EAEC|nr:ETX/MTX2 family pore-forming toxin [Bacillus sp. IBL03825]MCR6850466.1 ETX/MTX2 family pore-forming toxin [Bacillus sp. IBL03825]